MGKGLLFRRGFRKAKGKAGNKGNSHGGHAGNFTGALVKKASDQTGANFSSGYTAIAWDTAVLNSDGLHSAGANTRFTVPASLNGYWAVVSLQVQLENVAANIAVSCAIGKNGSTTFAGSGAKMRSSGGGSDGSASRALTQCSTHMIQLATDDYFEGFLHNSGGDTSVDIESDSSFFSIYLVGSSIQGVLVKKAADATAQNYSGSPNHTWDTDVYDDDGAGGGFHDTGSNTSRITIPASVNGRYGIFKCDVRLSSVLNDQHGNIFLKKNGSGPDFLGSAIDLCSNGAETSHWLEFTSAPLLLTTADYYEVCQFCQDTSVTFDAAASGFSLYVLPAGFQGVCCTLNANVTADWTTSTPLAWDGADVFDTNAAHDPSSNNTKIIVPSAWNGKKAFLIANIRDNTATLNAFLSASVAIFKNGTRVAGMGGHIANTTSPCFSCRSPVVELATGDEFTCNFWNLTDTSVRIGSAATTFSLIVLSNA